MGKSSQESDRKTNHFGSTSSTTCGQLRLRLASIPPVLFPFFYFLPVFLTTKWNRFPSLLHSTSSCPVLSDHATISTKAVGSSETIWITSPTATLSINSLRRTSTAVHSEPISYIS